MTRLAGAILPLVAIAVHAQTAVIGAPSASTTTGLVGTHTDLPQAFSGTPLNESMMWSFQYARKAVPANSARPLMANFYVTAANVETAFPGTSAWRLSIEYPKGTILGNCVFAGGSATASVTGAVLVQPVSCPHVAIPAGAMYWTRAYFTNPNGIPFTQAANAGYYSTTNEAYTFGNGGVADLTLGGTVANTASGYGLHAAAVIGPVSADAVSLCIWGDSREHGDKQVISDITGDTGDTAKLLGSAFNYTKLAIDGTSAYNIVANDAQRLLLAQYCTHNTDDYGINDLIAGQTASQIVANRAALASQVGNPMYGTTVYSYVTSTDNFATLANQTISISGLALSSAVMFPGVTGEIGEIDFAGAQDPTGSGKVPVSPNLYAATGTANFATLDGLHNSAAMSDLNRVKLGYVVSLIHK